MIERLRRLWRKVPWLLIALVIALLAFSFFTVKSVGHALDWWDDDQTAVKLEPWMTVRFVGRSYDIPPEILLPAFGLAPSLQDERRDKGRITMRTIALLNNLTLDDLEELVEDAAEKAKDRRDDRSDR